MRRENIEGIKRAYNDRTKEVVNNSVIKRERAAGDTFQRQFSPTTGSTSKVMRVKHEDCWTINQLNVTGHNTAMY